MKKYLYYAILIDSNNNEIAWNDRAENKTAFINSEYMQKFIADGWKIKNVININLKQKTENINHL